MSVALMLWSNDVAAQERGLHNDTKKFTNPKDMEVSDFDDPKQIRRSWNAAIVWVPDGPNRSRKTTIHELVADFGESDVKFPLAIYLHGCSGIYPGTHRRMRFLANNGFLVIAPASMARTKYPMSCDPHRHIGGMYHRTLKMRQHDAGYAIETAKAFPFVDPNSVVLIGLSEGGITTATFKAKNEKQTVSARVIEGWTCAAGWFDYAGLQAPENEPVLSISGEKDPWFQNSRNMGNCGTHMSKENGSRALHYRTGRLAKLHAFLELEEIQSEVLLFLKEHIDLPLNVREVQQALVDLGYDPGPVDGVWGGKTLRALNALRVENALESVDQMDVESQELLRRMLRKLAID